LEKLQACGIHAASITYDAAEKLCAFGEAYHIAYPLLSDVGSHVIRAFGIFNTNVPADHKFMYGMPWPGNYLIARDGTVRDKLFLPDYQLRPSASAVVLRHFGERVGGASVEIDTAVLRATVSLSTDRCFPGQELGVSLQLRLQPGWHVYGKPLPGNYQATELVFDSPLVGEYSLELPPPKPMLLPAVRETLPVYEGELRAVGKLGIKWSPPRPAPFLQALGKQIEPGGYTIKGELRFQACSHDICEAPQAIPFELPLQIEAGIPPAPTKPA
jgi:AhpC/TSA family/Disulphide bond corrector protein DsbC